MRLFSKWFLILYSLGLPLVAALDSKSAGRKDPPEVHWEMDITQVEILPKDGLRISARLGAGQEQATLQIRVPGGTVKKGRKTADTGIRTFDFPVYLEASESDAAVLDGLVSQEFGDSPHATLFDREGYLGSAISKPVELGRKGGMMFVSDPVGKFLWSITVRVDPRTQKLIFTARETSYG